jgi:hypothetical protein
MYDSSVTLHLILPRVCMYHDWKALGLQIHMKKLEWMILLSILCIPAPCEVWPWQNETSSKFDVGVNSKSQTLNSMRLSTNLWVSCEFLTWIPKRNSNRVIFGYPFLSYCLCIFLTEYFHICLCIHCSWYGLLWAETITSHHMCSFLTTYMCSQIILADAPKFSALAFLGMKC